MPEFDFSVFRRNVQEMFERELKDPDGNTFEIKPGMMEGPNQTPYWLGSCYLRRFNEDPSRVNEGQTFVVLRVFQPFTSEGVITPTTPFDPTALEQMSNQIMAAILRNPSGLGAWYQRVQSIDIDPDVQGVQAAIFAYSDNPGT